MTPYSVSLHQEETGGGDSATEREDVDGTKTFSARRRHPGNVDDDW